MSISQTQRYVGSWRAIQSRPCYEKIAAQLLATKGYEVFLPVYQSLRKKSDRSVNLEVPLFPGYLFCRCDGSYVSPILNTCGVMRILGTRGNPAIVEESEIDRLMAMTRAKLDLEPWSFIESGQAVRIQSGPLRGIEGIVIARDDRRHKLLVSITLLRRSAIVSLDPQWLIVEPPEKNMSSRLVQFYESWSQAQVNRCVEGEKQPLLSRLAA
ncbi:MAG TPA: transcription termination/antitermination NusG family protein [Candidatus Angelobacter sp.]|jgi:transcription antitermination factor NusG|nr:transcription termination/antitermination NusG family protein [Candidatus Angelobacter sp.]